MTSPGGNRTRRADLDPVFPGSIGNPGEPLVLAEVPEPVPGPGEVRVGGHAYSVNRGEMFFLNGVRGTPAQRGWRPGQDITGPVLRSAPGG
jgi:NADPH:quinone reductase-like Zn-dependent oxidoreductase